MTPFLRTAKAMARELEQSRLVVILIPAKRGAGMVRHAEESNPRWYRDFCAAYARYRGRYRKAKTYIKRRCTIHALRNPQSGTTYALRLAPFIHAEIQRDAERDAYERKHYAG